MALTPLAAVADLTARGIDTSNTDRINALLDEASDSVRDAAGSAISRSTSTVTLWTEASRRIELPARPVQSVAAVTLDGVAVTDYKLRGSALWRDCYWQLPRETPGELVVTFTHGYVTVPADIVGLVCSLVAAGLEAAEEGYDPKRGKSYERIDDYQYGMQTGDDELVTPMELPDRTREWLRTRFGTGSTVMGTIR